MRAFVVKAFDRFQRREKITDAMLCAALDNASKGLIDADLGAQIIRQRVARAGQGKSSWYRALMAFRRGRRAVFLYGFAKKRARQHSRRPVRQAQTVRAALARAR